MGLFSFLFGNCGHSDISDPYRKYTRSSRISEPVSESDGRNVVRNLYSIARSDFSEYVNIRNIQDYYKRTVLDIISGVCNSGLEYNEEASSMYMACFISPGYRYEVSAFEYAGENWGRFYVSKLYSRGELVLTAVRGHDTDSFYRNTRQGYTLSPLRGLTEQ